MDTQLQGGANPSHRHNSRWRRRLILIVLVVTSAGFGLIVLLGLAGWFMSTHDMSPVARLFLTQDKCDAIDSLRRDGLRVSYLRCHYRRNGWKVVCADDPTMDDVRLARLARHLKVLEPSILFMPGTNVGDTGVAHLSDISSIEFLDLGWTKISDASLKSVATMPLLKELYLNNTGVGDDGLRHLEKLSNLQLLAVGQSRVTERGIADFTPKAPHVYVDNFRRR